MVHKKSTEKNVFIELRVEKEKKNKEKEVLEKEKKSKNNVSINDFFNITRKKNLGMDIAELMVAELLVGDLRMDNAVLSQVVPLMEDSTVPNESRSLLFKT